MVTIIQHGETISKYRAVCPSCKCVFAFGDKDVENEGPIYDPSYAIRCPDCGYYLRGYEKDDLR